MKTLDSPPFIRIISKIMQKVNKKIFISHFFYEFYIKIIKTETDAADRFRDNFVRERKGI